MLGAQNGPPVGLQSIMSAPVDDPRLQHLSREPTDGSGPHGAAGGSTCSRCAAEIRLLVVRCTAMYRGAIGPRNHAISRDFVFSMGLDRFSGCIVTIYELTDDPNTRDQAQVAVVSLRMPKIPVSRAPAEAPKRFRNGHRDETVHVRPVLAATPSPYRVPVAGGTPGKPL